jgi:hypothetical protein
VTRTHLVEGELTVEDTSVVLTTQGSIATGERVVPQGATRIERLIVAFAASFDAADQAVFYVRIIGAKGGNHIILVGGAGGSAVQAGADPTGNGELVEIVDVDIGVIAGQSLTYRGEMVAGDLGDATIAVNPVFS